MYIAYYQYPGVENLNQYRPGGYHPVHLNDTFANGRYTVVHKLGFGTFYTVWLVCDGTTSQYLSLKILTADASQCSEDGSREFEVLKHLRDHFDENKDGNQYVLQMLDHFDHQGHNGLHHCIVTELMGPKSGI